MKYLNMILFCMVACSSSVAQESKVELQPPPVVVVQPEIEPVEIVSEPEPERVPRDNKLEYEWLSRICVSEGGFSIEECEKILQTLENMKADKPLLSAMYAQSARVTRRKPFTDTRQIWVSYLPMNGDGPPTKGWVECTDRDPKTKNLIPKGCTGTWRSTVKKWTLFREDVRNLYYSGIIPDVLPGKPIQWGGDMDYWIGVGRNFCPLNEGGGSRNTYWGDPKDPANTYACLPIDKGKIEQSKMLSAEIASGRAMRRHRIPQLLGKDPLIPEQSEGEEKNELTRID